MATRCDSLQDYLENLKYKQQQLCKVYQKLNIEVSRAHNTWILVYVHTYTFFIFVKLFIGVPIAKAYFIPKFFKISQIYLAWERSIPSLVGFTCNPKKSVIPHIVLILLCIILENLLRITSHQQTQMLSTYKQIFYLYGPKEIEF